MVQGAYRELFDLDLYPRYQFHFVGTQTTESEGMRSPRHEGHSGWTTLDFVGGTVVAGRPKHPASAFVERGKPDLIIFHLGTNDGKDEPEMEKRYNDCLAQIYSVAPNVKIVWALCLWKTGNGGKRLITATHDAANAVAKVWQAKGKQIEVVDPSVGFDPGTMTEDGTHPTAEGYRLLADAIEAGFKQIMAQK